jgi:hypothetical protein
MDIVYDMNMKSIKNADIELYKILDSASESSDVEILQSKNGHPVPKVRGFLVHSAFDPVKEAEVFIKSCESIIESQDILLVMGYGFGYHVDELVKKVEDNPNKSIFVIEPSVAFFKKVLQMRDIRKIIDRVTFIVGFSVSRLFSIPGFYKILNAAPYTIGYNPAVKVNEDYFVEFIKRRSSNLKEHLLLEADEDKQLMEIINRFDEGEEISLKKVVENILSGKKKLNHAEKMFLLLGEFSG